MRTNVQNYLLDEKHLERFIELVSINPNFESDRNYTPAGYILSASGNLFEKAKSYISVNGIDFPKMIKKLDLTSGELPAVQIAYDLFANGGKSNSFSLTDLVYCDFEMVKAIIDAIKLHCDYEYLEQENERYKKMVMSLGR